MNSTRGGIAATLAATLLGVAACEQGQEPAQGQSQPQAQSAPAQAQTPAAQPASTQATGPVVTLSRDELLARGKYLVETIAGCGNCHTPHNADGTLNQEMAYAGAFVIEEPAFRAYAKNITPDMETGIGSWTEDQIVKALREGVRPDGTMLGPPMSFLFYRDMSDNDAYAIAAFLKTVQPIRNEVPASEFRIPLNPYGPPITSVPDVPRDDPVKYGEYLAGPVGHCMDCHTRYKEGQIQWDLPGLGGNAYANVFGLGWTAVSANITPTTLGSWTDEEIKRAITDGVSRDGRQLLPAMPFELYKNIEDRDLDAIVAYLRSLRPLTEADAQ